WTSTWLGAETNSVKDFARICLVRKWPRCKLTNMKARANGVAARVLVVDDQVEIASFVQELLTNRGHLVRITTDSRQAIDLFSSFQPDLCILDFHMPYISGSVLLDRFKAADPTTEVVFLTGNDETSVAVDLMRRGAIDFLLKPIDLNQLGMAVSRALDHR